MSIKISFLHYMKWTRVMLPVVFEEFEVFCIFLAIFSFHYNCQLVKGQLWRKCGRAAAPPAPSVSTGLYLATLSIEQMLSTNQQ